MTTSHSYFGALTLALGLGLAGAPAPASAAYPERPVRLVIPFAAGGPADLVGRELAQRLGDALNQTVIVENAGGGHGVPALNRVLNAPADGYTLLMPASGNVTIPSQAMRDKDVLELLDPITQLTTSPHMLVVTRKLPVTTLQELIDYAKAHPGTVNFGSAGVGGIAHMGMELFKYYAQVDVVHVPYRGTSQVLSDIASGQVQALFSSVPSLKPMIDGGMVTPIAMSAPGQGADTANLPTLAQAGLPEVSYTTWYGLFAKAGTPPDAIRTLRQAIDKALEDPALHQKLEAQDVTFVTSTPAALADLIRRERAQWSALIERAGIQID